MNFLSLAKQRCAVRSYENKPVEAEKLEQLLEAARIAPTAANQQSQRLLVIQSNDGLKKIAKGVTFHSAPLGIIVCADRTKAFVRPFDNQDMTVIDGTIVADHIVLEAEDLGLSSCWLTYFEPDVIRTEFKIPQQYTIVAILAIGYAKNAKASPNRHATTRKPLSEIAFYEKL